MGLLLHLIFWLSLAALVHTYLLYPILINLLAKGKSLNSITYKDDELPVVHVLMAVHNEEKVISQKIQSLLNQDYNKSKYHIFIGSDASSDQSNKIITAHAKENANIHFFPFKKRQGKPGLINQLELKSNDLMPTSKDKIFLLTDANVMLESDTLKKLARHFKNDNIALVDSNMIYQGIDEGGIAAPENSYLNREVRIKNDESRAWGKMIGPFGGCYAIRSTHFTKVPQNYLVDDFYIAMHAMKDGALAINDLDAKCYEKVSIEASEEYRRKKRISTGNFQNLFTYWKLLNPFSKLGFSFISHKVLRWLGPFFIIAIGISTFFLASGNTYFQIVLGALAAWFVVPFLVTKLGNLFKLKIAVFNAIHYFNFMNVALLHGFFTFIFGVKSGIWEPTKR